MTSEIEEQTDPAEEYVTLMVALRQDPRGLAALTSLDVIDAKAGGMAGLIGGFSAAATFIISRHQAPSGADAVGLAFVVGSLVVLAIAGILCATCLFIISHFDRWLFADLEGCSTDAKINQAAKRIAGVYGKRVRRYKRSYRLLLAGILVLLIGVVVMEGPW